MKISSSTLLKIFVLAYENLVKKSELKVSGVSGFSFWVIGPIWKDGKDGKFTKPNFSGK